MQQWSVKIFLGQINPEINGKTAALSLRSKKTNLVTSVDQDHYVKYDQVVHLSFLEAVITFESMVWIHKHLYLYLTQMS